MESARILARLIARREDPDVRANRELVTAVRLQRNQLEVPFECGENCVGLEWKKASIGVE
jgi:hypothetical protein